MFCKTDSQQNKCAVNVKEILIHCDLMSGLQVFEDVLFYEEFILFITLHFCKINNVIKSI